MACCLFSSTEFPKFSGIFPKFESAYSILSSIELFLFIQGAVEVTPQQLAFSPHIESFELRCFGVQREVLLLHLGF